MVHTEFIVREIPDYIYLPEYILIICIKHIYTDICVYIRREMITSKLVTSRKEAEWLHRRGEYVLQLKN